MTKPAVTITISGAAGSGKSILAQWIASNLQNDYALDVTLADEIPQIKVSNNLMVLPETFEPAVAIVVVPA